MSWRALVTIVFWGLSFIATKIVLRELDPFSILTLRYAISGLVLLLFQLNRDKNFLRKFSFRDWIHIFFLSIVGVSVFGLLQAYGLLYTTAINTGWMVAINPILITLAARFFLGEVITLRKISGILIGFLGLFFIISKGVFSLSLFRFSSTFGDLLVFASVLSWTLFTVGGKGFISRFTPLAAITAIMIAGFFVILPLNLLIGGSVPLLHLSLSTWLGIFFLGFFCSGLGYLFWYSALEKMDSGTVGMYLYLEPLVTLIGAILLLNEKIYPITLLGGGITLFGVYLTTWKKSRQRTLKNH